MVREARREAEAKGSTLPEVTMSTVNRVEGTVKEFSYPTYLGNNAGADMSSTVCSEVFPRWHIL